MPTWSIGAVSMKIGSAPRALTWWMRARGFSPYSCTAHSEASRVALAPSEIWLATAAVSGLPSASGGREAIFSRLVSRGPWSIQKSPTGTISLSKRPFLMASRARSWLRSAHSSMSRRLMFHFSAISCAPRNCDTSSVP
ncbi:Uncharacterised protein [Mycobacteroides abscessus subsp. abscessus]|nr:Uncharacterised protein [Mycobacteroides abscessus subsp. abscessus]